MNWHKPVLIAVVVVLAVALLIWIVMVFVGFGGLNFLPSKTLGSPPEIQRAEFPFKLEYEINGNITVVEDVLIGEFVRNNYNMGLGKVERVWKARLESESEHISLYKDNEIEIYYQPTEDPNIIGTFMGEDTVMSVERLMSYPITLYIREGKNERFTSVEELNNTYNIRLISWEIAPPIQNSFKE